MSAPQNDLDFCPTHGNDLETIDGQLVCPVCNYVASRAGLATCCSGTSGRMCSRAATILARKPRWTKSVSAFCDQHRPDSEWITVAASLTGFVTDALQPVGTPAYYGLTAPSLQEQE